MKKEGKNKKRETKGKTSKKRSKGKLISLFSILLVIAVVILFIEYRFFDSFYLSLAGWIILVVSVIGLAIMVKTLRTIFLKIIEVPYYTGKGIIGLGEKAMQKSEEAKVKRKREDMKANYQDFKIVKSLSGNYKKWEGSIIKADSKIGLVLGARGSGKTAFALKLLENLHTKTDKKCYAIGFLKEEMPAWIEVIEDVSEIKNNSVVLIDEGGVLFSSRRAMTTPNKLLSDLIFISRHKNLTILFISQNSANLEINVIRQADFLAFKQISLLQKDFERKKIREIYEEIAEDFEEYKDDKSIAYIYSDEFKGFVGNPLPSFWSNRISKSFG